MKKELYPYILFGGLSIGLLLSNLPYLNLIFTPEIIYIVFIVILIITLKLPYQILPSIMMIFTISLIFFSVFSQSKLGDKFGEYLYFLLVITFILYIINYFKENKR